MASICFRCPHIQCATSLAIIPTGLPPQSLLSFSRTMMLRLPLRLPFPYLHHSMPTKPSWPCRHLTIRTPLVRLLKTSPFLSPHQIKPLQVRCEKPPPWVSRLPSPLRTFLNPPHHSSLPPYSLPFSLEPTQPPWYLPVNQTSHRRLLPIRLSTIYFIQVRRFSPMTPSDL